MRKTWHLAGITAAAALFAWACSDTPTSTRGLQGDVMLGKGGVPSNGTTLTASKTIALSWRCVEGVEVLDLVGTITVTNGGSVTTQNLTITDTPQYRDDGDSDWTDMASFVVASGELAPGETKTYDYTIPNVQWNDGRLFRNTVLVTITNHSGSLGTPKGPNPKSTIAAGDVPVGVCGGGGCTLSQGYYKNHDEAVTGLTLGNVAYTKDQIISILDEVGQSNKLVKLAHHLIALELAHNTGLDYSAIATEIAAAHALIGDLVIPPVGAGSLTPAEADTLIDALDAFIQANHCGDE